MAATHGVSPHSHRWFEIERNAGRVIIVVWVLVVGILPSEVVAYFTDQGFGNVVDMALVALAAFALMQWERVTALVVAGVAMVAVPVIVLIGMNASGADLGGTVRMAIFLVGIPGLLGASLVLDAERREHHTV